jgi:serine/threonine protein kinase
VPLEVGLQPIPGYRLVGPLGAGAFGEVWEAEREDHSRVALKFLDCRSRSPSMVASEVRILRALTSLQHGHIIPLLGVHACGRYVILIMERADGSLADLHDAYRQQTGGNVPPDHALDLLAEAACALDFLAAARLTGVTMSRGLQHCDVKPSNLLVVGDTLKVGDFGLCAGSGWVTHNGGWKGTYPYAAPELYNGAGVPGTDQFALAVTFCELVMGDRPFWKGGSANRPPAGPPIDMTKLRDREFPVISRALHPYPSARWPSCTAFVQALRKVVEVPRGGPSVRIFPRGRQGSLRQGRSSSAGRAVRPSGVRKALKKRLGS